MEGYKRLATLTVNVTYTKLSITINNDYKYEPVLPITSTCAHIYNGYALPFSETPGTPSMTDRSKLSPALLRLSLRLSLIPNFQGLFMVAIMSMLYTCNPMGANKPVCAGSSEHE